MTTPTTPEQARELADTRIHASPIAVALRSLADQVESLTAERDAIKQQAQIWKMEASAHKSTVQECYQACTGSTGEPGDWNGANPVRELVAERDTLRAELEIANAMLKAKLENSAAGAQPDTKELEELRADAELGRCAMRFVDRAGDVHPGIDEAETICKEFHEAMAEIVLKRWATS